ncbi:unnamed protein product [Cuscuta epithymum]|uniref:RBR-type E3 ubiquitin transferase n=1 Tax=Cuscuta epithymum TaxID=186058 RepID=A0AAV0CPT7_9ASTE|nr:unnamed protein product [Cuscuta epithymum]
MDDCICISSEEEYYSSDQESLDGLENEESGSPALGGNSCKVITKESLLAAQREDLQRVMDLLSIGEHHARTLLIHHRWDVEKLFADLVEKGKSRLFAEAGVSIDENNYNGHTVTSPSVMCNICMEELPGSEMTKMDCGHCFCNSCWTEHFIVKIKEGQSKRIRCMAHKCFAICDEAVVRKLVSKDRPDLAEKFERFLLESYIEDNKMVKWCPSIPHCGSAIRIENDDHFEVECSCGLQFCFSCLSEAHSPCSCLMWELWAKKCRDESETVNWITVHTKPCPKCHKAVEKNGGCNLVSCICGQAFCWLCGGATGREHTWSQIAGHSCGRYVEDTEKKAERAKRDLSRYMHYHNRYKAHTDSFKQESRLREIIIDKVSSLEARNTKLKDFSWVTTGLYRLFRSRRALSYSYPFAYYMFGDDLFKDEMPEQQREIKKNLFEDQQQQLEANVEKLSKFIEEPFDGYNEERIMEVRMQVINLSVLTDTLCKKMYDCIENELLGSLVFCNHSIAPYQSKGIVRATELSSGWNVNNNEDQTVVDQTHDGEPPQCSASSDENNGHTSTSRKRARNEKSLFDLNLPAELLDKH